MNYIKKENGIVYVDDKKISKSVYSYLENKALDNFKTLKSIRKFSKNKLLIKRNIPLYINDNLLLVPLSNERNDDSFFYNHFNVKEIKILDYEIIILFKNSMIIRYRTSRYILSNQLKKVKIILDYIANLE